MRRYLLTIIGCLSTGWIVGACMRFMTHDPFDDDLAPWVMTCTLYFGTIVGLVITAAASALLLATRSDLHE